jgi:hypothetical protein
MSMGGVVGSAVALADHWSGGDPWDFTLVVTGSDNGLWVNRRDTEGIGVAGTPMRARTRMIR